MSSFDAYSREQLRQSYADAWKKRRTRSLLTALEALIADVIELHPEYQPMLEHPERALEFLQSIAEKPARRFQSLDEAARNFRVLPRETLAKKEILDHVARRSFKQHADGRWTHKLDRRTMIREPSRVWKSLHRIACPALIVKIAKSPLLDRELTKKMVEQLANGRLVEIDDSYHHVMLDNPGALIEIIRVFVDGLK